MTFPSWRVLIALVIGWTVVLFGADFIIDPHSGIWGRGQSQGAGIADGKAYLRIWLRYPCRAESTCLPVASDAVKPLVIGSGAASDDQVPWMTEPKLVPYKTIVEELANAADQEDAYSVESILIVNRLEAEIPDPKIVDFMEVIRAFEAVGLVPDRVEFEGPGHFTIEARVPGLRDGPSRTDATEAVDHLISEYRKNGYYRWLDSVGEGEEGSSGVAGDAVSDSLRFFPALGARVDIMEVYDAVRKIGLSPSSITIGTEAPR